MKRIELISFIKEKGIRSDGLSKQMVDEILKRVGLDRENVEMKVLNQIVHMFLHKVKEKLGRCNRMYEIFE